MPHRLDTKVGLVTGGARGQGEAEARLLAAEGAVVFIADVRDDLGVNLAEEIRADGGKAEYVGLDVTDSGSWKTTIELIETAHGRLDFLVNNAGIGARTGVMNTDADSWHKIMEVNLTGPFLGMQAAVPLLTKSGGGSIVNICSMAATSGYVAAAYTSSKWGLRGLTKAAATEFAGWNIRVNAVHPGLIETPMVSGREHIDAMKKLTPLGRAGQPSEVANLVLFLVSDESSYMTGSDLSIDGGYSSGAADRQLALANGSLEHTLP